MTDTSSPENLRPLDTLGRIRQLEPACITLRSGPEACAECRNVCPTKSITWTKEGFSVDADCLGCGRCAAICPTGALQVKGFEDAEPLPSGNVVRIECWKVPSSVCGAHTLRVPCLGGISPSHWLALAEAAAPRRLIAVDRGWCEGCRAGCGARSGHPASDALDIADVILAEAGWTAAERPHIDRDPLPAGLMPAEIPTDKPASLGRRALFRRIGDIAREATGIAEPPPPATPRLLRTQGMPIPERERLLTTAARLAGARGHAMPAAPFITLSVGAHCGHHGVCAGICPTGALAIYEEGETAGLAFNAWRCIGCSQCASACPQLAITLAPAPNAQDPDMPQILTRHLAKRCRKCLEPFHGLPGKSICTECQQRETMARGLFSCS